jgi:predicted membrane protein
MTHKKKKALRRELVLGSGLLLLFLPVIAFAAVWALLAVGLGGLFAYFTPENSAVFWPMLAVYGTLLTILVIVAYRFSVRLLAVIQRLLNIRREQQRVRADSIRLEDHEADRTDFDDFEAGDQQLSEYV